MKYIIIALIAMVLAVVIEIRNAMDYDPSWDEATEQIRQEK